MRNPTIVFARPRPESTSGEPIELSVSGDMQAEFGSLLHWPDPRTGPSDRMSSRGFVEWLCGRHTNLERNILIEGFVRHLRKAANREITMFFKTAEPPALRIEIRLGRIAPVNLKLLRKHARTRTLAVQAIEDTRTGVQGAACFVGSEIIGVFAARDMVVLER